MLLDDTEALQFRQRSRFYIQVGRWVIILAAGYSVFFLLVSVYSVLSNNVSGYSLIAFLLGLDSIAPIVCVLVSNRLLQQKTPSVQSEKNIREIFAALSIPFVSFVWIYAVFYIFVGSTTSKTPISLGLMSFLGVNILTGGLILWYYWQTAKMLYQQRSKNE